MAEPTVTLREHLAALREADLRFDAERDRRLTEIATEREKALKIKETADLAALQLAREIQTYKDEKANELREQINSERGLYATKGDLTAAVDTLRATIQPISEYVVADRGRGGGIASSWGVGVVLVGLVFGLVGAVATIMALTR